MTDPLVLDMLQRMHWRHVLLMRRSMKTLDYVVRSADPVALKTKRDGPDGWTPVEILCHMRDYDEIFLLRARRILDEESPVFTTYNPMQMAIDNQYAKQDPLAVLDEMAAGRETLAALYESLAPEQLLRTAIHPTEGVLPLYDLMMKVGHHDLDHIEQMTRVLAQE